MDDLGVGKEDFPVSLSPPSAQALPCISPVALARKLSCNLPDLGPVPAPAQQPQLCWGHKGLQSSAVGHCLCLGGVGRTVHREVGASSPRLLSTPNLLSVPSLACNPNACRASGRGLQPKGVRVKEVADFKVFTKGAGSGELKVTVKGPSECQSPGS